MDKEYIENKYFDDAIRDLILHHHNFTLKSIERNVCVNGKMETETDVIMYCETDMKALPRKIGIELKENDLPKAIHQAYKRRKYFNYFYVVINLLSETLFQSLVNDYNLYEAIKVAGVGIISYPDKKLLYPSSFCSIPLSVDDVLKVKNEMP